MIDVAFARPEDRIAAVSLMFARASSEDQAAHTRELLEAAALGAVSLDGLLVARVDGTIVGSALYVLQPDGTAFIWPPATGIAWNDDLADALLIALAAAIDRAGARFAQCLLEPGCDDERAALVRNGFTHVADLEYLRRSLDESIPLVPRGAIATVAFDAARNADRFAAVIERTYQQTLDCPGFLERRSGADALASHQLAGQFDPERWTLYTAGDDDLGVLLLGDHPDWNAYEVVYMGVVPEARGRGLGRVMVSDALDAARTAGRDAVFLAVDGRNSPARNIYESLGFTGEGRRWVFIRGCASRPGGE